MNQKKIITWLIVSAIALGIYSNITLADEKEKRHKKLLNLMPVQYRYPEDASAYEKIMCILDYVSGMTDNYALELYRNLRGISVPEI